MAAHARKYVLWSYTTGDIPGGMRNALGHLTSGTVYVVFPTNTLKPILVKATLTGGSAVAIDTKQEVTSNGIKCQYLGVQPDGSHGYYFSQVDPASGRIGVIDIQAETMVASSDSAYNPLDFAVFSCYPATGSGLAINQGSYKSLIKESASNPWPNPGIWIDPKTKSLKFAPKDFDRMVFVSLQGDIALTDQNPCEWHFQLRKPKGDGTATGDIYDSVPTFRISGATTMKHRQVNIISYIEAGDTDYFVADGVVPCVHNTTGGTITLSDLEIHVYTISQPRFL